MRYASGHETEVRDLQEVVLSGHDAANILLAGVPG